MPAIRIQEFDLWREGYADATVSVIVIGTVDTLASLFLDEDLTIPTDNPVALISRQDGDKLYGKFQAPVYTGQGHYLQIDSTDATGVVRIPLTSLVDVDASQANVTSLIGTVATHLEDVLARTVYVQDFGDFLPTDNADASSATNNATLQDAISAAASGGFVIIPAGTYAFTALTIPSRVVLMGQGDGVTVLQSQTAAEVMTLGNYSGFRDLTLDGVALTVGSIGVQINNGVRIVLDDATIKRFDIGIYSKGGHDSVWRNLIVDGCTYNAKLHGDNSDSGGTYADNFWQGMSVSSVTCALDFEYIDAVLSHNTFRLGFENNAATAVKIRGARFTDFEGSWWSNNDVDLDVDDFVTGSYDDDNTVLGLWIRHFRMQDGSITLKGKCDDIVFERGRMNNVAVTLTLPGDAILVKDVVEEAGVTISGDGTKWTRWSTNEHGASSGVTTNNTATKAWSVELDPGQRCYLEAKVIGNARTSDESGEYHISVSARRPPSTLAYDTQTGNFATGRTITGAVSGATALIVTDTDAGATGTLELREIDGEFVDNEIITDSATGSATVNGTLVEVNAELLSTVATLRTAREDDAAWDATFVANGPEIELRVTGANSKTVEWLAHVDMLRT